MLTCQVHVVYKTHGIDMRNVMKYTAEEDEDDEDTFMNSVVRQALGDVIPSAATYNGT